MDVCDDARTAEIEKAVVEQAHCYLPPRATVFQAPPPSHVPRLEEGDVLLLVVVGLIAWVLGRGWRDAAHKKLPGDSSQRRTSR